MKNKMTLTAISFLANFVMAGFATQFGMLVEPIANAFNANVNEVASIFSLLNGGALAGTIAAFFLIEKVGIKRMTVLCYGIIALSSLGLYIAPSLSIVMLCMTIIGFCGGVGLCIAGTIVVSLWKDKIQSTMLVVQDATFNIAGVVFPLITTYALTNAMNWSISYLSVGVVALATMFIALLTNFSQCGGEGATQTESKSEWNFGIISGGIGLFLGMLALYTFLTWAPMFVKEKFDIPFEQAGNIITQYWSAALVGALVSTVIVSRMRIQYFLLTIITLAMVITSVIVTTNKLEWLSYLTYGYGFACAALYNAFIAYGVSFVRNASSKNVSYILVSGSAGAMFSPAISSMMESIVGLQTVMYAIPAIYAVVLVMLIASTKYKASQANQTQTA
ncbi:TsgA-like MFS transporter [Vibrio crassostreae]|uniref:MFS transporter TsgA n=1 Tax=Vibrio crassostreae TaxID=246167 RepID=UPI000F48431F|nr:MFS transporter TsgA [Vibrio crassostreae]ROO76304.1 TsgA-like MFS transporter [Vibrio crassostreae]ROP14314.1 TsgA-like MFS transporter [Vibrio crassostreae]ROQ88385.1 TsgA-like MFS transporter [Vibrio crassostreae]ROR87251.1 TsgA-like MFS transporter [Vibrio crassostreae]RPE94451.1 TsgA-like MFS transporter [Vibrio crassostreae]